MSLLSTLDLDSLTPVSLWTSLDETTRESAVRAAYKGGTQSSKLEADMAIARSLRFRPAAVKQLPLERRVGYVMKNVPMDDGLASTLLMALHLGDRSEILEAFLDLLGIPHDDGLIDEEYDLEPPANDALERVTGQLYDTFEAPHVDLYLAALVALDPETWEGVRAVLDARRVA